MPSSCSIFMARPLTHPANSLARLLTHPANSLARLLTHPRGEDG